jgi:palmitoyltransferase ZDHHC9/14/18
VPCPSHVSTQANHCSPFSQKNIQQCRCGTASCRGVLGPKPKKPVEDKSIASTIIAGTKRKFQTLIGSVRARSEDDHISPKKRKLFTGNSTTAKSKNADVESGVARERAGRQAAELSRQIASRQTRALKRSTPATRRVPLRRNVPSIKSTRITKVSFQPRASKEGALKPVKQASRGAYRHANTTLASSRRLRPSTPMQTDSEEEDSTSITITPASLRSASRKSEPTTPASRGQLGKVKSSINFKDSQPHALRANSVGRSRSKQSVLKVESKGSRAARAQSRARTTNQG